MKKTTIAVRVLLGLIFAASGVSFFLTATPPMEGPIATFFQGMAATQYFFPLLKITEIICGLLLISGRFVPLALIVLAPILVNIVLVHAFLAPQGIFLAILLGVMEVYLAFLSAEYSPRIRALFQAK